MEVKDTIVAYLIYGVMALYLLAVPLLFTGWLLLLTKAKKRVGTILHWIGMVVYGLGFLVAVAAFIVRWKQVNHAPMQNMFEAFLMLGMLLFPISLFCRLFMRVGTEWWDAILGIIVLFPAGFVFNAEPQNLPPALQSPLFVPHVSAYMLSYVILGKSLILVLMTFVVGRGKVGDERLVGPEEGVYRIAKFGFPLLTLGLVLGAWWGKVVWGDYWNWDPKELWSLVSWLIFVAYFHVRYMFGTKYPRINALVVLFGLLAIVLTLLWVNLAKIFAGGLHSYA